MNFRNTDYYDDVLTKKLRNKANDFKHQMLFIDESIFAKVKGSECVREVKIFRKDRTAIWW